MSRPQVQPYKLTAFRVQLNQDSKSHKEKYRVLLVWETGNFIGNEFYDSKNEDRYVNTLEQVIELVRKEGEGDL